jgi:hypothetical protein
LSVVTWIPPGNKGDDTEKNGFISPDFVKSFISELLPSVRSKKMMSDLNFNPIPSEIKCFIPGKETVNDISNLFGSLQKMKIPQVESDIDLEVNLFCGCNVVIVNVYLSYDLFNTIINPC